MRFSRTHLLLFSAIVLFTTVAVAYGYYRQSSVKESPQVKWERRIAQVGAPAAYKEFANEIKDLPATKQHTQAHVFGGALYKETGIAGLSVCDDRFSWGCFHEFIGTAIEEHGAGVIPYLRNECLSILTKFPKTCVHAIGHGILAYLGYSEEDLNTALKMCDSVPNIPTQIGSMDECYLGVFMEFNLKSMLAVENGFRKLTDAGLFYPCDQLKGEEERACYYQQPQWWRRLIFSEHTNVGATSTYAIIGKRCSTLESKEMRNACYEGIGSSIAWDINRAPKFKSPLCNAISANAQDQLECKMELAYLLGKILGYPAQDACSDLQGDSYMRCVAWAIGKTRADAVN